MIRRNKNKQGSWLIGAGILRNESRLRLNIENIIGEMREEIRRLELAIVVLAGTRRSLTSGENTNGLHRFTTRYDC